MNSLFHAYIVGGNRKSARAHIDTLVAPLLIARSGNPDFSVREYVSFSIDDARELRTWQELVPQSGEHKVSVIYADFITREAENALLKTLEEPVAGTHIFIAIPNPHVLLPTLLSRVRVVMPESDGEDLTLPAKRFLAMNRGERLAFVAKLVEKSDDEEAAAEVRERALTLMNSLETELAQDVEKNKKAIESILQFKKYVYVSGASSRMLLETLALTV